MAPITTGFTNQKGGVGKSSLVHHLAGALADLGRVVLVVDLDGQGSLTNNILGPEARKALKPSRTTAAVAAGRAPDPADVILASGWPRVWIAPAAADLYRHNLADPLLQGDRVRALAQFLAEAALERHYDDCLIDCPPNLQLLSALAYAACAYLVVPTQPEDYSVQGIEPVLEFAAEFRAAAINPDLKVAGIVLTMCDPRNLSLHDEYARAVRAAHGPLVFSAKIMNRGPYKEALAERKPITRSDPKCKAADEVRGLALEYLVRVGGDRS